MSTENANINFENNFSDEGPKISFLEAFYGIIFMPGKIFDELQKEETFTIFVYGVLAVLLSNLGKLDIGWINPLSVIGIEFVGFLSWFFVGILIFFLSTVFKSPNNNLGRLLGYTGLSSLPFLLLSPLALIASMASLEWASWIYFFFQSVVNIWSFILFWIALAKCFQLEAWRVLLMAIIPFLLGIFLFTFLIANLLGMLF